MIAFAGYADTSETHNLGRAGSTPVPATNPTGEEQMTTFDDSYVLVPRDNRELNQVNAGDTNEGIAVIQAYVDGILKTEMEWANARGTGQAYVFTESATRQDVTDVDGMVNDGRMGLISVIRWALNPERVTADDHG